jgi:UDP-GlcNAc:undecaprenyl-phosphate/decaprenyl-phosphate GlcNAc-1-phosphate transferase
VPSLHPGLEYVLVACVAAAGSYLLTPLARRIAIAWGAVATPRDRDVHAVATPRMGGVALFVGLALALFVAARLPTLHTAFSNQGGAEMPYVLLAAGIICAVGVLDDRYELDSLTKLAGQVLAASIMVTLGGVQLLYVPLPLGNSTISLGQDLGIPVTILLTVLTVNAINFIDGLDGLAAGVTAIGAGAFFIYAHHLASLNFLDIAAVPTLLSAALAGTCIGFLPHNFAPARIFMGDSGSMLVGIMLSAAATTATTSVDPQQLGGALGSLPLLLPLLIPVAVLAIPFVDLLLAIIRRVHRGQSPFAPDKQHLHHRLLQLGHSHRRAVLLLYFWSALLAFGGVAFAVWKRPWVLVVGLSAGVIFGVLVSAIPRLNSRRRATSVGRPAA